MGAPRVFAGDLAGLTEENIQHYNKRFKLLDRLQTSYNIYNHFQFSGVPAPTDTDWHWWGKLNNGNGAVVVVRGHEGAASQKINIPWVEDDQKYALKLCFSKKDLGTFTGRDLKDGKVKISLPKLGQGIIEISEQN